MGQGQSQPDDGSTLDLSKIEGFQIVRLLPHSPAHQVGLVPYFDIIVGLDHHDLRQSDERPLSFFKDYISSHAGQPICLTVFNLRIRSHREVYFTSHADWSGGILLGCSIHWNHADEALKQCLHITDVLEGSPAAACPDLHAGSVYIIGMQDAEEQIISLFKNVDDLYDWFSLWQESRRKEEERCNSYPDELANLSHSLLFLIYDIEENSVKEVVVDMGPNYEAPIGFVLSSGLLHLIPGVEDGDIDSLPTMNQFFLPQDLAFETNYPEKDDAQKGFPLPSTTTIQVGTEEENGALLQQNTHSTPPQGVALEHLEGDSTRKENAASSVLPMPVGYEVPPQMMPQPQSAQEAFRYVSGQEAGPAAVGNHLESHPTSLDLPRIPAPLEFPLFSNSLTPPDPLSK